jgi:hypothetical protein
MKERSSRLYPSLLAGFVLLIVGLLTFREFLLGNALLIYTDIGIDSFFYHLGFVQLSNYMRTQGFPSWSFYIGMGQDLAYLAGDIICQPVTWLPGHMIPRALAFQHLLKILIAGLFFFHFLTLRRLRSPAPLLGSLLLSFSAYACMGSCWYLLADEVVCFSFLLWSVEIAIQRGRWLFLAIGVALIGMITPFHLYLAALFLSFYVPMRLGGQHGWQPKIIARTCLGLAAVATLGLGLGAIITFPALRGYLDSPRGSGTMSSVASLSSTAVWGLASPLHYVTAALKPFSNDILGTGSTFRGWQNYLEAPITYCGLLCLLLLPQVFLGETKRRKVVYALFVAITLVLTIFPWFRYLFWLFEGDYCRDYSLFWVLGTIGLSLIVFSRYIEARPLNLWLLMATAIALIGILYLPIEQWQSLINSRIRSRVVLFLLFYTALLIAGQLLKKQHLAAWLILAVSAIELIQFDRITVTNRHFLTQDEMRGGILGETAEWLKDIKVNDHEKFFRLRKLPPPGLGHMFNLNDALAYGYYGTSFYGSFNSTNYIDFLIATGAIPAPTEEATRWSPGLLDEPFLSLFACEKYALTEDPTPFQNAPQYEFVKQYGNTSLYRNLLFLPFGLTFDHYISEEVFRKLPKPEKAMTLFRSVVLPNDAVGEQYRLTANIPQAVANSSLPDLSLALRKSALQLTVFNQTRFEGKVSVERTSILVMQTPFDTGWRAWLDGRPVPTIRVDAGLLGIAVDPGSHHVKFRYHNPARIPAAITTIASLLILVFALRRWPPL